jgi:hypothetical protein
LSVIKFSTLSAFASWIGLDVGVCGLLRSRLLLNALAEPLWTSFGVIIIYAMVVKQLYMGFSF